MICQPIGGFVRGGKGYCPYPHVKCNGQGANYQVFNKRKMKNITAQKMHFKLATKNAVLRLKIRSPGVIILLMVTPPPPPPPPTHTHPHTVASHIYPSLVRVQPMRIRPNITERFLMGRKESNQTKTHKHPDNSVRRF